MHMEFLQEKNRFYYGPDSGKPLAEITWTWPEEGRLEVNHTFTDPSLRGQGVARKLVERLARYAREEGLKVSATCPYAARVLAEGEFSDIYRG